MNYAEERKNLVDWLRKQLIGPASAQEILHGSPLDRYPTGILFPIMRDQEGIDPASVSEDDDEAESPGEDTNAGNDAEPAIKIKRRRYMPPSSVGFSFFVQGEEIRFQVGFSAARYEGSGERGERGLYRSTEYRRSSLGGDEDAKTFTQSGQPQTTQSNQRVDVLGGRASVDVLWKP